MHETTSIASPPQSSPAALANEAVPAQERQPDTETALIDRFPIQLKLSVGAPNDPFEHEADAMADKVMRMPDTPFTRRKSSSSGASGSDDEQVQMKPLASEITPFVQRCSTCTNYDDEQVQLKLLPNQDTSFIQRCTGNCDYDDEHVQLKPLSEPVPPFIQRCACDNNYDDERAQLKPLASQATLSVQAKSDGTSTVNDSISYRITSGIGGGDPMDKGIKNFMESRFMADFSTVKIHNGEEPAQLNRSLNARAFTIKDNIYFNSGQYQPETDAGKRLLAHELTHVVQQNSAVQLKLQPNEEVNGEVQTQKTNAPVIQRAINDEAGNPANSAAASNGTAPATATQTASNTPVPGNVTTGAAVGSSAQNSTANSASSNATKQTPINSTANKPGGVPVAKGKPADTVTADPKTDAKDQADTNDAPVLTPTDNPGDVLAVLQKTPATNIAKVYKEAKGVVAQSEQLQKDEAVKLIPVVPESKGSPYGDKNASKKKFTAKKANASEKNLFSGKGGWTPPTPKEVAMPAAPAYVPSNLATLFVNNPSGDAVASTAKNELDSVDLDESSIPAKLDSAPTVPLTGEADVNNVNDEKKAQTDEVAEKKATAAMEINNDFGENDVIPKPGNKIIKSKYSLKNITGKASSLNEGAAVADPLLRNKINASAADHINSKIGEQTQKYSQDEILYRNKISTEKTKTDEQINVETAKSNELQNKAQADVQNQVGASRIEWQKQLDDTELDFQTKAGEAAQTHVGKINEASNKGNDEAKKHYDDANEEVAKKKAEAKQDADDKKREAKNESKGFWGWLADKASALIDGLKKAVSFIFNKLRAAVKWAFDKAKKLAMMAIEFARNVVVGLIKAFGEALKVLVDIAFAAFPEIRDKINGKIDQAVNKAVSVANQAFDKFKEVVAAVIDAFAAFADAALAIVQKSIDIALSVTEFVIVASLKIIGFLSDIERQYNLFKGMIDDLLYLWDNPQVVEDKAHEFLAPYIENVPENAKSEIKKALDAVGLGAEKHFTGIMKYLMPALINLKTNWWQQAKDMVWFLIWPFGKGSPLREDGPKLWTLLPQIWNDFKAGEYSRVIDGGLEWMQALNSVVGSFAGWFVIGGALIGGILGAIFGVGAGALPGAGAGFEAGVAIGEGIMASMLATEGLVIVKAVYDLSVTADDGVESPIPEKKIEKPDDSQTKNEAPSTEGNIAGNGPVGPEKKDDAPRQYTSGEVKTGHDRIQYAYQRIATSGLTLGIMLAFILLGAIGGKIAKAIVSGIKWVGKIIGELAPELTEGVKGIAKGITESKPVQAIKGAVKGVSESKAGQKIKAGLAKFNKGRAGMKKKISSFKKKFGLGEPEKPTASKPGEKSADNTNINEPKDNVTGRTDTEPVKPGEKPVDPEKTIDKGGDHEKIEIPETGKTANSPVDAEPSGKAPVSGSDIEDLPPGSVMMGDSMNEVDAAKMYRNSIKETPGREVGIYHNPETNEFIIIQGDEGAVYVEGPGGAKEGPTGGRAQKWKEILDGQDAGSWDLVSHYHPADEGGFVSSVNRLPSGAGGDFGVLMDESANVGNKSRTSKIDFKTPRGDEFTFFSYEPGEAKPYKIDYPDSVSLKREKLEFGTLQEYHAWMMEKYNVDLGPVTESVSATGNQPVSPSGTPSAAKRKVGKGITADEPVPAEAKKATGPGDNEPGIKPDHVTDVSEPLVDENASSEHGSDEHTNNGNAEPENEVNKDEQPKKRLSSERRNEIRENAKKKLKELEKRKVKNQKKIDKLGDQLHDARANVNRLKEKVLNSHAGSKEYKSALKEWRKANEKLAKIIEDDELAGYWEERRKQGEAENAILASLELKRPSLREPTIKAIRDAADKTPDGKFFLDANTKEIIQGEPHYGHIHGKENRRLILEASEKGMTQEQFNDWVNSHPEWFQTETPANNISHRFEKPGID